MQVTHTNAAQLVCDTIQCSHISKIAIIQSCYKKKRMSSHNCHNEPIRMMVIQSKSDLRPYHTVTYTRDSVLRVRNINNLVAENADFRRTAGHRKLSKTVVHFPRLEDRRGKTIMNILHKSTELFLMMLYLAYIINMMLEFFMICISITYTMYLLITYR